VCVDAKRQPNHSAVCTVRYVRILQDLALTTLYKKSRVRSYSCFDWEIKVSRELCHTLDPFVFKECRQCNMELTCDDVPLMLGVKQLPCSMQSRPGSSS
jgi:hypothetical protein